MGVDSSGGAQSTARFDLDTQVDLGSGIPLDGSDVGVRIRAAIKDAPIHQTHRSFIGVSEFRGICRAAVIPFWQDRSDLQPRCTPAVPSVAPPSQVWLDAQGGGDAVIDGSNVAQFGQNYEDGRFRFAQLKEVRCPPPPPNCRNQKGFTTYLFAVDGSEGIIRLQLHSVSK